MINYIQHVCFGIPLLFLPLTPMDKAVRATENLNKSNSEIFKESSLSELDDIVIEQMRLDILRCKELEKKRSNVLIPVKPALYLEKNPALLLQKKEEQRERYDKYGLPLPSLTIKPEYKK